MELNQRGDTSNRDPYNDKQKNNFNREAEMKLSRILSYSVAILLISSFTFVSSGLSKNYNEDASMKDIKKETKQLMKSMKDYSVKQKDKAVKKTKKALDNLDNRIDVIEDRLDEKWDEMSKKAREEARQNLKELRKKRNKVSEWYGSMKTSTKEGWKEMKDGFSAAYEDLYKAWKNTEKEFSSDK
jgi:hypothetical protein